MAYEVILDLPLVALELTSVVLDLSLNLPCAGSRSAKWWFLICHMVVLDLPSCSVRQLEFFGDSLCGASLSIYSRP